MVNNPKYIIVHCTDIPKANTTQFFQINAYHRDFREFPKSSLCYHGGYHILVNGGKEYRYMEDWEVGSHCNSVIDGESMNFKSLGLGWGGDGDIEFPDDTDLELIKARLKKWQEKYDIPNERVFIGPHRRWTPTKTCYGSLLADDWAFLLLNPPAKSAEILTKQAQIEMYENKLINLLRELILQLKIQIGMLNKRQKTPQ